VAAWAKPQSRRLRSSTRRPRAAPRRAVTLGFDAGKKVKGRKRHLVVDTLGLLPHWQRRSFRLHRLSRRPLERLRGHTLPNGPSRFRKVGSVTEAERDFLSK
jgi:hypothetical protein